MKKNTLLIGLLALLGTSSAFSQNLYVELMKSNAANLELQDAKYDLAYGNVGHTSLMTVIGLGEVDFGADGSAYKATGVEFAQGWGDYGIDRFVVLHAGPTFETSVPFNEMKVDRTFGYHCFENYAENMKDAEGFTPATGVQKVWLTFREGAGNLRSVTFYKDQLEEEGVQPWLNELPGYEDKASIVYGGEFQRAFPALDPENDEFKDCNYDENNECWGGIRANFVIKTTEPVDFGDGGFKQLVAFIGHDGERYKEYMEFYIDEVTPENMVARVWSGINLQAWNDFSPAATKLEEVKGSHHLFVKFGAATNLHRIDLLKEELWFETPLCGVQYEDLQPSASAVEYVTLGAGTSGGDPSNGEMEWKVIVGGKSDARGEGSNIGYTSNGVVVAYYDIDFKDGQYKSAFLKQSSDKNVFGEGKIEEANIAIYAGLDDSLFDGVTSPEGVQTVLASHTPVAIIRAQATGGWGEKMTTGAFIQELKGYQTLHLVYNLPDDAGLNIHGLYLDPDDTVVEIDGPAITTENLEVFAATNGIIINTEERATVAIYTVNGSQVVNKALGAGTTTINNLTSGLYIVKVISNTGTVSTHKLMVK